VRGDLALTLLPSAIARPSPAATAVLLARASALWRRVSHPAPKLATRSQHHSPDAVEDTEQLMFQHPLQPKPILGAIAYLGSTCSFCGAFHIAIHLPPRAWTSRFVLMA